MRAVDLRAWAKYLEARNNGYGVPESVKRTGKGISLSTAYKFERGEPGSKGLEAASQLGIQSVAGKMLTQPLSEQAAKALADFAYFRLRYMGRRSAPWQERAAYEILRHLETDRREYVIINCPPGSGKSTLFTHDIPAWLIAQKRTIRIQMGSMTERQARQYVYRLKKTLERGSPLLADADELALGIAVDAVATMAQDYGAFKPEGRSDIWAANEFTVRQVDGSISDNKEKTVSAWGQDSGILGGRYDLTIWDDLVDSKNTRGHEARDKLIEFWEGNAVRRLEPRGLLILQGQRIAHNDLYRYCLDQKNLDETPKYQRIVYPAHDDDNCRAEHGKDAKAWPEGCLLDPYRIPWTGNEGLETIKHNSPRTYEVLYQQRDGDLVAGLVQPAWINGGVDTDGYPAPGCLDADRAIGIVPAHLRDGAGFSFITVDPSPTEWWGIIWWVYDPESSNRYIVDIVRRKLNPEQFLTVDMDTGVYSGVMVDLHADALRQRAPLRYCVVEINAAQRWLLSQPHVQRWMEQTHVYFVPHTTHVNKADPKYGVESTGDLFRQGRIRIPWGTPTSRLKSDDLIKEALRYPDGDTTDLVMSTWFAKLAVENLYTPVARSSYQMPRPSWLRDAERGMVGSGRGLRTWR